MRLPLSPADKPQPKATAEAPPTSRRSSYMYLASDISSDELSGEEGESEEEEEEEEESGSEVFGEESSR